MSGLAKASPESPGGAFAARHFTRDTPLGEPAEVEVGPGALTIRTKSGTRVWPFEELRQPRVPRRGEPIHLERSEGLETLVSSDAALLDAIRRAAPAVTRRIRPASRVPFLAWAVGLAAVIALLAAGVVIFGIPALAASLARTVPVEWETQFGAAMLEQLAPEADRIHDPRVVAPIDRMVSVLSKASPDGYRYRVAVVNRDDVNALAAPGGHIAVFRGLIEFARSPEELAGVLAHEMAHVGRRHVTEGIFERASLGLLIALMAGDASGPAAAGVQMARALGELSYSRNAEAEADRVGLERMIAARIDPSGMPELLSRLGERAGGAPWAAFLSSHPAPQSRARALRDLLAGRRSAPAELVLTPSEWSALRAALHGGGSRP